MDTGGDGVGQASRAADRLEVDGADVAAFGDVATVGDVTAAADDATRGPGSSTPDGLRAQIEERKVEHGLIPSSAPETEARIALLWQGTGTPTSPVPSTRGRPARFVLDDVVSAGIDVARAEGLNGLSMRKVARNLGVGAMSLYTYVPGREELVDLMIDRAHASLALPGEGAAWREGLVQYAAGYLAMYERDPWLLEVNRWRLPLAPHVLDAEEAGLRVLAQTALPPQDVAGVMGLVDTFVSALARDRAKESADGAASGQSIEDYWTSQSVFWERYFDVERYPTMTRMWLSGAFDVDRSGAAEAMAPLLDAVERAIAAASA